MASKPKISAKEVAFALSMLKYMGVSAAKTKPYLIVAVIAWLRQESGGLSKVIGNNPFNIRKSKYAIRYRKTKNGNGSFAVFATLDAGARATVALLKSDGADGWRGYGAILKAANLSVGASTQSQQKQAVNFLDAIAASKWDAAHYGYKPYRAGKWLTRSLPGGGTETIWVPEQQAVTEHNLIKRWAELLNIKFTIPADAVAPSPTAGKEKPKQQRHFVNTPGGYEYLKPYDAFNFYEARRRPIETPGDTEF